MQLRKKRSRFNARKDQTGFVLLEALVSIVILAVAVLGMLGVQLRTLAETQTGVRRAQAVRLIEDLAERVKSNPEGFAQMSTFVGGFNAVAPPGSKKCNAMACNPAQLAQWDIDQWRAAVAQTLPLGQAAVFTSTDETVVGLQRQLGVVVGWRANESKRQGESTSDSEAYAKPFLLNTGAAKVDCPATLICHVTYVQP